MYKYIYVYILVYMYTYHNLSLKNTRSHLFTYKTEEFWGIISTIQIVDVITHSINRLNILK